MRKLATLILLILFVSLTIAQIAKVNATPDEVAGTLRVSPIFIEPKPLPGETFTIDIVISGVSDCYMAVFTLCWDPMYMNATKVTKGDFLEEAGVTTTWMFLELNRTAGYIREATYTRLGDISGVDLGSDEGGIVATIEFTAVAEGTSPLNLTDVEEGRFRSRWKNSPAAGGIRYQFESLMDGEVEVIPEFPAYMLTSLFLIASLIAVVLAKRVWSRRQRGHIDVK